MISSVSTPLQPSFGYSNKLKTFWKKGLMPTVTKGLYGGNLTVDNVTLEHIRPKSKGGITTLRNLALATARNNQNRSSKPLAQSLSKENFDQYIKQFEGIQIPDFNGDEYIRLLKNTIKKEGIDFII